MTYKNLNTGKEIHLTPYDKGRFWYVVVIKHDMMVVRTVPDGYTKEIVTYEYRIE